MTNLKHKVLLHQAIFHAIFLATLLRHKLHEKLLSISHAEMKMSRNIISCCSISIPGGGGGGDSIKILMGDFDINVMGVIVVPFRVKTCGLVSFRGVKI